MAVNSLAASLDWGTVMYNFGDNLDAVIEALSEIHYWLGAFAGGAFGAALGALPVFIFTGFLVIAGEASALAGFGNITGAVAFGPVFGPHTSFAGGAAAAAYAAKKGYMKSGFDYHNAKDIAYALGTKPDVLLVGGAFGVLGMVIRQVSAGMAMPWDPIAMGVTLGALFHRLILGYSIIGKAKKGYLNMTPFENEERRGVATDGGEEASGRFLVEPWLPHQYKWPNVATLGIVVGLAGGYMSYATGGAVGPADANIAAGSAFLGFGISAASLVFLNCGVEQIPVTHHITLPASTAFLAVRMGEVTGSANPPWPVVNSDPILTGGVGLALIVAAVFGMYGALLGELHQRIFYAHGDTHWDPPAASIVVTTLTIALLTAAGVFASAVWVPYPF